MRGLEPHNDAALPDFCEESLVFFLNLRELSCKKCGQPVNVFLRGGSCQDFHHLAGNNAAKLGGIERGNLCKAILLQPRTGFLIHDDGRHRIISAGEPLSCHNHVRLRAVFYAAPHVSASHESRLNLIRNIHRTVPVCQLLNALVIARERHRKARRCRDALYQNRRGIFFFQDLLHGVQIVVGHMRIQLRICFHVPELCKHLIARLHGNARGAVEGTVQTDDALPLCRPPCKLYSGVNCLPASVQHVNIFHGIR